jgi:hypothetical protein
VKHAFLLLLAVAAACSGLQSTQAWSAQSSSKFRTCKSFDGPFQIPVSQQCPLSGYAHESGVPTAVEGKPKAAPPPAWTRKFRTCSGIDGTFQVPVAQKCPLSGYSHY